MVRQAQGFAYLTVLFIVAIMTGGLAVIGQVWHMASMREREADLLQVGHEYRKAIERYYLASNARQYPRSLSELVKDPRQPATVRHLRRLYSDPITGAPDWGVVQAPDGGIAGVYSLSAERPLKTGGFATRDAAFEGKTKYSDWQFVFAPQP